MVNFDSRHIKGLTPEQRKEILYRAVPKMINNFNGMHCTLFSFGVACNKCPFGLNYGQHCDLRAILAVVLDDMEQLKTDAVPYVATEPVDDWNWSSGQSNGDAVFTLLESLD